MWDSWRALGGWGQQRSLTQWKPLQAAVHDSLKLTRSFGLAPSWVQWSVGLVAATSRHGTVESSSPAGAVVTVGPTVSEQRVKDTLFFMDLVENGNCPFKVGDFLGQAKAADTT